MLADQRQDYTRRRKWLCVAYAFPPMNRSGTHRTVGFVRHLFARGWDATVLTVTPDGESIDKTLSDRLPPSTLVVRTRCGDLVSFVKKLSLCGKRAGPKQNTGRQAASGTPVASGGQTSRRVRAASDPRSVVSKAPPARGLRQWVSQLLQTPDSKIGWIPSAVRAGLIAIRRDTPEVIYSTSPYVSAHLVAMILKWRTKLPWVADFRDPWGDNPFRDLRFRSVDRLDSWLERFVLRNASHIVMNTPTARDALCDRFPRIAAKCSTITNGIDFDLIGGVDAVRVVPDDCFALTHCGQFYGPRSPQPWFDALRELRTTDPTVASRVRLVLVGGESYGGSKLTDIAADAGIDDLVVVVGRKSHSETLSIMAGSDTLVLATNVGAGSDLQIPNKLFEYLGMGKAIVAAVDAESPAKTILDRAGSSVFVCVPGDPSSLAGAIRRCVARPSSGDAATPSLAVKKLDRTHQAAALARIFDRLTGCESVETASPSRLDSVENEGVCGSLTFDGGFGAMST